MKESSEIKLYERKRYVRFLLHGMRVLTDLDLHVGRDRARYTSVCTRAIMVRWVDRSECEL